MFDLFFGSRTDLFGCLFELLTSLNIARTQLSSGLQLRV